MQYITPPKKYVKGDDEKLVLNPEYKRWMEGKLKFEEDEEKRDEVDIGLRDDNDSCIDSKLPTAVAVVVIAGDDNTVPMITASPIEDEQFNDQLEKAKRESLEQFEMLRLENQRLREKEQLHELEKSKRESLEQLEMLRLENQRLHELALLKAERDRLEKAKRESKEINLLREENERLKCLARKNKAKKTVAPAPAPAPPPKPKAGTKLYAATVPRGIRPGQTFKVCVNGSEYNVICPANARSGQKIHVPIKTVVAKNTTTMYTVKVPSGVRVGQTFKVKAKGKTYIVTCPKGARQGQNIHVPLRLR